MKNLGKYFLDFGSGDRFGSEPWDADVLTDRPSA